MTKINVDDGKTKKIVVTERKTVAATKKTATPAKRAVAKKAAPAKKRKIEVKTAPKKIKVEKAAPKKVEIKKVAPKKPVAKKKIEINKTEKKPVAKKKITINAAETHETVQKSTTLAREFVKKPEPVAKVTEVKQPEPVAKIEEVKQPEPVAKIEPAPVIKVETKIAPKAAETATAPTPKTEVKSVRRIPKFVRKSTNLNRAPKDHSLKNRDLKERALKSAARAVKRAEKIERKALPGDIEHRFKRKNRGRRIFFAMICSAATVGALVAFVNINMPDISVRVAAMQTGIEATYPTFIPRYYSLSNVESDKDGIVTMKFNGPDGATFTLSEEKSTWDSNALLNNYVKKYYPSDYVTLREQGITIYTRGESASWVNGGLLYKIESTGKYLTKEQIRNIATSL